jgi:hypothetical protein
MRAGRNGLAALAREGMQLAALVREGMQLAALVREGMQQDPFATQALYVFIGRGYDALKILSWDRNGFNHLNSLMVRRANVRNDPNLERNPL